MEEFSQKLARQLAELAREHAPSGFAVAYSGGLDSTVLLAACCELQLPVRALHVNHRLNVDADDWMRHCAATAARLGVEFEAVSVDVRPAKGQSLEASARALRYETLARSLRPREMLLTAHHADDQLETVLMRLFRGAGVKGLRGILASCALGHGFLGRPLLGFTKDELVAAARAWKLVWIDDPSNTEQQFDRNYLRGSIVPLIKQRWPGVDQTIGRTARHMSETQSLLESLAAIDAQGITELRRIALDDLTRLARARQRNVLRVAVAALGLPVPSADQLNELVGEIERARCDAQAAVRWPGAEARIHGGHLHLIAALPAGSPAGRVGRLAPGQPWSGPEGRLALVETTRGPDRAALADACVADGLEVRFRRGGERLKPAFDRHHRKLKKLLQEAGIVPWMRSRIPLLYRDDLLVAVGDLWVSDAARAQTAHERAWQVRWTEHPALR